MAENMQVQLVDKASGESREVALGELTVGENQVVQLPVGPEEVAAFDQQGMDLVITLQSGEELVIEGFFGGSGELRNELVLEDSSGVLWWGQYEEPWESFAFTEISEVGQLVAAESSGVSGLGLVAGAVGAGGLAAAAAGSSSSGSSDDGDDDEEDPGPDAPEVDEANANGVSGTAEAGTTITLTDDEGEEVATTETDADGEWSIPAEDFPDGDPDGFEGEVTATDDAGNESDPTEVGPIDGQAPDAPEVDEANANGVSGTAEAGTTITLTDDEGEEVATTETDADGEWSIPAEDFPDGDPDGFEGEVTATDDAGNESDPTEVGPIDGQAPDAPVVDEANADGLSGTAKAGATITLTDDEGQEVATTETNADGKWSIPAGGFPDGDPAGFEGEVTATDDAGNESEPTEVEFSDTPQEPEVTPKNSISIAGEAGPLATEVELLADDGEVLLTSEVESGTWAFEEDDFEDVDDEEILGYEGAVRALSEDGFTSDPVDVAVDSIFARDLGGVSEVEVTGLEDQFEVEELDDLVLEGGLLGIGVEDSDSLRFAIEDGDVGALQFEASSGSVLSLLDQGFEIELSYREDSDEEFETLGTLEEDTGLLGLDLLGLLGTDEDVAEAGLESGEYELELRRQGGVELLSGDVALENIELLTVDPDELDPSDGEVDGVESFEGDLASMVDVRGDPEFEGLLVGVRLAGDGDFEELDDGSVELEGEFGTLTVEEDGSLEYVAEEEAGNIGETDEFEYRVEDPDTGDIDEGRIDMEVGFYVT
ncbi:MULTISPECIES: Ig-like domain-containing protein [unclassified Thioalkalivibrio]|uniref:Ig-like domain-containing protein n=1 Tax=unclassified Thioalkalivibrio TaxID=2621013 RepID=UPI000378E309|nr:MULTISPECIES: Ig-like domain-containing protein [unclassified Thioalkalivibrio]